MRLLTFFSVMLAKFVFCNDRQILLIIGRFCRSSPNTNFANITEKNVNSRTKWKSVQAVTNMYWNHWIKEYLPLLKLWNKWTKHRENMKIGDIVIFEEDNIEWVKWSLAWVLKLFYGKDGVLRSVKLKTKYSTLHRPDAKLCVLEEAT